jgi:hypothetical protein
MWATVVAFLLIGRLSVAFQPRPVIGFNHAGHNNGHHSTRPPTAAPRRPHTLAPLAGVAGGTAWLRKQFPEAFWESIEPPGGAFDHAYVDSNDFLHSMTKRAKSPSHLFKEMGRKLDTYSRKVPLDLRD